MFNDRQINNRKIVQVFLIAIVLLLVLTSVIGLKYFVSGFLGAVTLYILFRNFYFRLTEVRGWGRSLASITLIFVSLLIIAVPLWLMMEYLIPQAAALLENRDLIINRFEQLKIWMADKPLLNRIDMSSNALFQWVQRAGSYVPVILGSVASMFANIVVAFFVLYFMQINSKRMEKSIQLSIPFSVRSRKLLWLEVEKMVRSNTIGIPVLAICQGIVAAIGFMIFGVNNALLWGLFTGAASIIPVVGTMVVWVPVCIFHIAAGNLNSGIWLAVYCLIVVGGIDNILRFTILKSLGNVPPLITVFGVILGINLFGMLGVIFGPLLLSMIGVLMQVYRNEFGRRKELNRLMLQRKADREMPEEPVSPKL